jgi:hypothetical protein
MNDEKGNICDVRYVVVYEWMNLAAKRAFSIREHIETAYVIQSVDSEIRVVT